MILFAWLLLITIEALVVIVRYMQELLRVFLGVAISNPQRLLRTMATPAVANRCMQMLLTTMFRPAPNAPSAPIEPPADSPTKTPLD